MTLPEVSAVAADIDDVLTLLNTALDLGLTVLGVVRTFTTGTLNPLKALLDAVIALCRTALVDLRQLGLYAHVGDLKLLRASSTLRQLKGGYAAYEQRMVARLNDRHDPRRPEFNGNTTVLAIFVYSAVDVAFVNDVLDLSRFQSMRRSYNAFARLLGVSGAAGRNLSLPAIAGLRGTYSSAADRNVGGGATGSAGATMNLALGLSQMLGRTAVTLSWQLAPAPGAPDTEPEPVVPPAGFLVEVSCFAGGLYVGWMAPAPSSTGGADGAGSEDGAPSYYTGTYEEGDTGQPLQLYGGANTLHVPAGLEWEASFDGAALRPGATPVFYYRNPDVPETLHNPCPVVEGRYYNQRTFFVGRDEINLQALTGGGTYTRTLTLDELPLYAPPQQDGTVDLSHAVAPTAVWVRVTAVTDLVTSDTYARLKWDLKPHRSDDDTRVQLVPEFPPETRGVPSPPVQVLLPTPATDVYGLAVQAAVALTFLSRSDIVPADPVTSGRNVPPDTTYRATGLELAARTLGPSTVANPQEYFAARGSSPDAFTRDLARRARTTADALVAAAGNLPPAVLAARAAQFNRLLDWKWSDSTVAGASGNVALRQTLLQSLILSQTTPATTVLARNVYGLPAYWQQQGARTPAVVVAGLQAQYENAGYGADTGGDANEAAPCVYDPVGGAAYYVRQLVPDSIYAVAAEVLNLAGAPSVVNGWRAWRPLVGTSALGLNNRYLQAVEGFMRAVAAGTQGVESAILQVISFLENRVKEIQELIRRLDEFLDVPFAIAIPDLVALPLVVNGTDGVIQGLVGAGNKPTDGPAAYAGGLVILGGGLPSILTELILYIISPSSVSG